MTTAEMEVSMTSTLWQPLDLGAIHLAIDSPWRR